MLLLDPIFDEIQTLVDYDAASVVRSMGGQTMIIGYRGEAPLDETLRSSFPMDLPDGTVDRLNEDMPLVVADVLDDTPV